MFIDPLLNELGALYREASKPANGVFWGDGTSRYWYDRFHAVMDFACKESSKKKREELNQLVLFALYSSDFPNGILEWNREKPDSVVKTVNGSVGVELSKVFIDESWKRQEIVQRELVQRAHELYRGARLRPMHIDFCFSDRANFKKNQIRSVALQLVKCIPDSADCSAVRTVSRHEVESQWLNGLEWLVISPLAPYQEEGRWDTRHGGHVHSSDVYIQAAIDKKDQQAADYARSGWSELWLLLIVEGSDQSSLLHDPMHHHFKSSQFSRIFVLWQSKNHVSELSLLNSSIKK